MRKLLIATLAALGLCTSNAYADNLIANGDFSQGYADWTEQNSCCNYTDANGFHEGAVGSNGMLSQTFTDVAGGDLTLTFDYGGNSGYQYLSFDSVTVPNSYVADPSAYQSYTFDLGLATGLDTLTFNGQNDPSYNTLDNVVVTESVVAGVPEPISLALLCSGLLGLAGIRRRKVA